MGIRARLLVGACLLLSFYAIASLDQAYTVYATQNHESAFLRNFNPTDLVKTYVVVRSWGGGQGASAGYRAPWNHRPLARTSNFFWDFPPIPGAYQTLMARLRQEAERSLGAGRGEIIAESSEAGGFTIAYREGRATGKIAVRPPKATGNPNSDRLEMKVEEQWSVGGS